MAAGGGLLDSHGPLAQRYDVALLDLDGVVYVGGEQVPGAAEALAAARSQGMRLTFVTNNASRTPAAIAAHLRRLGICAAAGDVVTSSQAAAHYLADRLPPGAKVLVVGANGLQEALRERRLTPVSSADDAPVAVVQGYSPDLDWRMLAEACIAINRGVPWLATNLDATVPSPRGRLPGNGSLVAALRHATGVTPTATGKPDPTMHRETVERSGARRPLVVGDRLDTDIEGADRVGCDSLLVLSGVTDPADVVAAPTSWRPTYLGWDVGDLLHSHSRPVVDAQVRTAWCGGWLGRAHAGDIALEWWRATDGAGKETERSGWTGDAGMETERSGPTDPARKETERSGPTDRPGMAMPGSRPGESTLDALRTVCALSWTVGTGTTIRAADDAAQAALSELRLQ